MGGIPFHLAGNFKQSVNPFGFAMSSRHNASESLKLYLISFDFRSGGGCAILRARCLTG